MKNFALPILSFVLIFAREKFGLMHRYAMALHTHQPHPTVRDPARTKLAETRKANLNTIAQGAPTSKISSLCCGAAAATPPVPGELIALRNSSPG